MVSNQPFTLISVLHWKCYGGELSLRARHTFKQCALVSDPDHQLRCYWYLASLLCKTRENAPSLQRSAGSTMKTIGASLNTGTVVSSQCGDGHPVAHVLKHQGWFWLCRQQGLARWKLDLTNMVDEEYALVTVNMYSYPYTHICIV